MKRDVIQKGIRKAAKQRRKDEKQLDEDRVREILEGVGTGYLIDKAVNNAKALRQTILKIQERQNRLEDIEAEEEAEKEDSDYPADELQDYMESSEPKPIPPSIVKPSGIVELDRAEVIDSLEMADALLYKLMSFSRNNTSRWIDIDDTEERTQLKLKEIHDRHRETLLQTHLE